MSKRLLGLVYPTKRGPVGKNLWRPARYLTCTQLDQRQKERDEMERVQEEGGGPVRGDVHLGAAVKFAPRHDESLMKLRHCGTVVRDRDGPRCVLTAAQLTGEAPRGGESLVGPFKRAACSAPSVRVFSLSR